MNLQIENSIFETEFKVKQALQRREGGKTEYETLVGFADLVTDEYVIEIKHVSDWKEGLKVLAYQDQLPTRKPRIHLFGGHSQPFRELVEKTLTKLGVTVTWEEAAGS
jgi:hypothetical protein